jgi:hypothetical protein
VHTLPAAQPVDTGVADGAQTDTGVEPFEGMSLADVGVQVPPVAIGMLVTWTWGSMVSAATVHWPSPALSENVPLVHVAVPPPTPMP